MEVQSWDVFDTLIARTVPHPTDIFSIVEQKFPYTSFKEKRITAERMSNGTIKDIYNQFQKLTGESTAIVEKLRKHELQCEMDNTIPIESNVRKMKPTDILVSDMYLEENDILALLKHNGIETFSKLYVYSGGKHYGFAWEELKKTYTIVKHTGDNMHSDIHMAEKYGIKGIYTDSYKFTKLETSLLAVDTSIAQLFRRFRLSNPYCEKSVEFALYNDQINLNIPFLIFVCRKLARILQDERRTTVLFLTRDGCLIIKLFKLLYPQFQAVSFHSSRLINEANNVDYIHYLKQVYNKDTCVLFDLHGSFNSARQMFLTHFNHLPRVFLVTYNYLAPEYEGLTYLIKSKSDIIEDMNADLQGTLCNFIGTRDIRQPLEYKYDLVKVNHTTVEAFCSVLSKHVSFFTNSSYFEDSRVWIPHLENIGKHNYQLRHNCNTYTLTYLANKYNSDKGNSYKCAHHYTLKYEDIIDVVKHQECIDCPRLLEIGLNRDNSQNIPSLMIWKDYFNDNVDITGFDIQQDFLKFNGKYSNIRVFAGDQSNPLDLHQVRDTSYHIIIDDGYHASEHQQVSFKTLWDYVEPGGFYIIEDLHWQPNNESCMKTRYMFEQWSEGNYIPSNFIAITDINDIKPTIQSIEFYDSRSKNWKDPKNAMVVIRKCK